MAICALAGRARLEPLDVGVEPGQLDGEPGALGEDQHRADDVGDAEPTRD